MRSTRTPQKATFVGNGVHLIALAAFTLWSCSSEPDGETSGSDDPVPPAGGSTGDGASTGADGGAASGGSTSGGAASGGAATGGSTSGGASSGGSDGPDAGGTGGQTSSGGAEAGTGGDGNSGGTTSAGGTSNCEASLTANNKAAVEDAMVRLFVETDASAFEEYWADPYLQHNPVAESGVDAFWSFFGSQVEAGNPLYSLSRVIGECELVLTHGEYGNGPVFDMFRLEDGKLVEHWDAMAVGPGPNSSGNTALDGPTLPMSPELTPVNKQLVLDFTDVILIGDETSEAATYMSETLIEHNAEGANGRDAFLQYRQDNSISTSQVHHVIGDGDFVFTMTEGAIGSEPYGFYDLYRIEGGLIAEHWEGRRAVPDSTASGLPIF